MNSEHFQVVTIEVTNLAKTKELLISKSVELIEGDYAIKNPAHQCPTTDGSYPVGMPENWYLLGVYRGQQNPEFDNRILVENQFTRPVFEPHPEFPDYFQYRTDFSLVERTLDELISTIKQMEREANLSIQSEADKAKMEMFIPAVSAKYGVQPLTDAEQNVYTRMLELADKGAQNAANAARLISIAKNNADPTKTKQTFDVSVGWTYDAITLLGSPFDEL